MHGQRHWEGAHTQMSWPIDNVEFPNKVLWSASKGSTIVKRSYYLSKLQNLAERKSLLLSKKARTSLVALHLEMAFPGDFS